MTGLAAPPPTVDAFLGGRVEAVQPDDGSHRSGLEAVLLAAALPAAFAGIAVDLGAGVGVAGMCLVARCPAADVMLVERDPAAVAAARVALARPANAAFAARVAVVAADVAAPESERAAAGLGRAFADAVVMNPPFYLADEGAASPVAARTAAHRLDAAGLDPWLRASASALKPGGTVIVIFRADGLGDLIAAMDGRFGDIAVLPIHPRPGVPAHRILIAAIKGSRAPLVILPGLTLHAAAGSTYVPEVDAVLRDGAALAAAHPAWGR